VHPNPDQALSDGGQSLKPERFAELVAQVRDIAQAVDRSLAPSKSKQPALAS
jgi:3-deoxy-7-phosphoheptulonate synthase